MGERLFINEFYSTHFVGNRNENKKGPHNRRPFYNRLSNLFNYIDYATAFLTNSAASLS